MTTKVQACCVAPESNAMTEIPAANSQNNKDMSANNCEAINQIKIGLREASLVSKTMLLYMDSPEKQRDTNFTRAWKYLQSTAGDRAYHSRKYGRHRT